MTHATMVHRVDLSKLTEGKVRNLAGHDRGLSAREFFSLDDLDNDQDFVEVLVPDDFRAVSPSFFEGMFAKSVKALHGLEKFLNHYRFNAPTHVRAKLIEYATRTAGRTGSQL